MPSIPLLLKMAILIFLRPFPVQGHESFRLTPDMQTRACATPVGQLQPSTQYPLDPVSIDDDDKSTDMAPCLRTTSGNSDRHHYPLLVKGY